MVGRRPDFALKAEAFGSNPYPVASYGFVLAVVVIGGEVGAQVEILIAFLAFGCEQRITKDYPSLTR
jgi:hypothetical protein